MEHKTFGPYDRDLRTLTHHDGRRLGFVERDEDHDHPNGEFYLREFDDGEHIMRAVAHDGLRNPSYKLVDVETDIVMDRMADASGIETGVERGIYIPVGLMAGCSVCGQTMLAADGCVEGVEHVDHQTGARAEAIAYGDEEMYAEGGELEGRGPDPGDTCHDCGAEVGDNHHAGCDWERCPLCGGQRFSCGCDVDILVDGELVVSSDEERLYL